MNKTIEFIWKVWLRPNMLTVDVDNDYIAEVSTTGKTSRNTDIAQAIMTEGSEIKYDTIVSILNQRDRIVRQKVQEGGSVLDGVCHIQPRITGVWKGANAKFDAAANHITVDMTPAAELRDALTHVGVEVLGVKDSGAYIGLVTDAATGNTDGTATAHDDIIITGEKIKIVPEDDETIGVFFRNIQTGETYRVSRRLTQNDPKKIIARLPDMPTGSYTLTIVTRYTQSHNVLLNEARTIVYERPLTVE
jgi:hypothetical protein